MPILILTGRNDEADIVSGLGCGANDYIAKPFRLNELLARLRAQLRLFDSSGEAVFSVGPYTFRPAKKLLQNPIQNRRVRLTSKEVAILQFLYRSDGCPVDRKLLLREVWGYDATTTTHRLEAHIYRLRLEDRDRSAAIRICCSPCLAPIVSIFPWRPLAGCRARSVHAATVDWNATSAIWFRP